MEQATLPKVDGPPSGAAHQNLQAAAVNARGLRERFACRRLRKLGLDDEAIAGLNAAERKRIAQWTAPSQLTGALYASLTLSLLTLLDVLRPWRSVTAAVAAALAVGGVVGLWVAIAYVSWKATARWGDPERRLGLAARRYLLNKQATGLDRRAAAQQVKWSMRRELQRATGFLLLITDREGDDLATHVRDVLVDQVKGRFVRPTTPAHQHDEGRSVGTREWAAIAAVISAAAALVKLFVT